MKRLIIFTIFFFTLNVFGQFSSKKMDGLIEGLTKMVTDSSYIHPNPKVLKELDEPILEYWVMDYMTYNEASSKRNFSDNETYSVFQKIYRKGKESDFVKMTKNENPAIRVYGFWALLKNKGVIAADHVLEKEKEMSGTVYWNSFGCEVFPWETVDLMAELLEKHRNR